MFITTKPALKGGLLIFVIPNICLKLLEIPKGAFKLNYLLLPPNKKTKKSKR